MASIPPPDPRELIPPVLACLPAGFLSPRPPPALLPHLSPILRQRVHLLTSSSAPRSGGNTNWLTLLSYSPSRAAQLVEIVENMNLEPHPVSGELELFSNGDEPVIKYRRRDQETLHSRCEVQEHALAFVWVWCVGDQGGTGLEALEGAFAGAGADAGPQAEPKDGWKLAEVLPLEDMEDNDVPSQWYPTMKEADDANARRGFSDSARAGGSDSGRPNGTPTITRGSGSRDSGNLSDDDDYWASYDRTPGRTPGRTSPRASPKPSAGQGLQPLTSINGQHGTSNFSAGETDYYDRYGSEVQPAMDGHDPDEETPGIESSFGGQPLTQSRAPIYDEEENHWGDDDYGRHQAGVAGSEYANFMQPAAPEARRPQGVGRNLDHVPVTEPPTADPLVSRLEQAADTSPMEQGIKTHVSAEIKSLFRLARGAGIEREEFERIVLTELELLDMLEL